MTPDREAAELVARRLAQAGHEVVFAGGCVRDRLLGRSGGDIDIASSARPEEVQALFERSVAVGAAFGVVKVLHDEHAFDVATYRQDRGIGDGRHPVEIVPATLEEDVERRDFTINGLVERPETGEVLDLVGGRADLERRVVRAIGDPELRFAEDALRLLRGVRFAAVLDFEIEPATFAAMRRMAPRLEALSGERVREELRRMLGCAGRRRAIELLDESGQLEVLLPELSVMHGVEQPPEYHPEGDVWIHTMLVLDGLPADASFELALGALLHDVGKPPTFVRAPDRIRFDGHVELGAEMSEAIADRLRLSRAESRRVVALVRDHLLFKDVPQMRPARLRRLLAEEHFPELLDLYRADCGASHGLLTALPRIEEMQRALAAEAVLPDPFLGGRDVIAAGVTPGPEVGRWLERAFDLQLEGQLVDRDAALAWLTSELADA